MFLSKHFSSMIRRAAIWPREGNIELAILNGFNSFSSNPAFNRKEKKLLLTFALESQFSPCSIWTLHNSESFRWSEIFCTVIINLLSCIEALSAAVLLHQGGVRVLRRCRAFLRHFRCLFVFCFKDLKSLVKTSKPARICHKQILSSYLKPGRRAREPGSSSQPSSCLCRVCAPQRFLRADFK